MSKPILSVVMPIYNNGRILNLSIPSILNQTFTDFELILVDDGSTDNSGSICDYYADTDNRIKVIHKKNGGAGSARNAGIDVATGEYIAFPDADDVCKSDTYESLMKSMLETGADLTLCLYERIKIDKDNNITVHGDCGKLFNRFADNEITARETWFDIRSKNIGLLNVPWNKIYKTDIIKENGIRFPDIRRAQDAVFNILYYDKIKSVSVIEKYLYGYNENDEIKVGKKFPKDVYNCFFYLDKTIVDVIGGWGMYYGRFKALCDNHLLGVVDQCLTMCENPAWDLSVKDKIKYLDKMISDPYLQQKMRGYEGFVHEIEDIIAPILKKDAKGLLRVLRKRKIKNNLRNGIIAKLYRKIKYDK